MSTTQLEHQPPRSGWLNRTVLGIGLASLFSDVGHEMATSAMPALLASIGASSAALGLIEGLSDGLASFAKLGSGHYSDRLRRRKPLAVIGYFMTASGMASFAFATQAWHVLLGRMFGWLGRGARTPVRNVLLTEATTKETYGRAFGLERTMDSAGAILGPLLALGLGLVVSARRVFLFTLIPGLCAALTITFLVREKPHDPGPPKAFLDSARTLPADFLGFMTGVGLAGLGDFSNTLLILWATQAWTARLGGVRAASLAMGFYVGYNVVYTASCAIAGWLADRYPKRRVLAAGYALAVVPAGALLMPGDSYLKFAVVFGISGVYMGFWETVESTTAATLLPASVRGVGFGVLATVNGIGDVLSSILVGFMWVASPHVAMGFVIATTLAGALVIASGNGRRLPTASSSNGL
ncbi:MAG TPA: MFS transporter [Polyangiaceae bacterium]|jgi:MFS family permease